MLRSAPTKGWCYDWGCGLIQASAVLVRVMEISHAATSCRAFGGCMKTLFEAAADLDVLLHHRAASLLAYFVSNNDYKWPWARWERVLEVRTLV